LELLCFDDYPDLPHPIALQIVRDFKGMYPHGLIYDFGGFGDQLRFG
jgi:hypothetical protein